MSPATQKKIAKKLFTIATLLFTPIFISAISAYSPMDEITFYYDFFAMTLIECSILYLASCLFFRKKRFALFVYLLAIGSTLLLTGIILFTCFYRYAFSTPETAGGHYTIMFLVD